MHLNSKVYDVLKIITTVVLPALGTMYFGLAQIWGLPYSEEVVGTITIITTALGTMLTIDNSYYKKNIVSAEDDLTDNKGDEE